MQQMPFFGKSRILEFARKLFSKNKEEREQARAFLEVGRPKSSDEARGLLDLLRHGQHQCTYDVDQSWCILIGLIEKAEEQAADIVLRDGPAVIDAFARQLQKKCDAWSMALLLLSTIGTADSLRAWVERFVTDRPKSLGLASLKLAESPVHADILFPRLLDALENRDKAVEVISIANAVMRGGLLPSHPLASRMDILEKLMNVTGDPGAAYDEARNNCRLACDALAFITTPESRALLSRALESASAAIRMQAAGALARMGHKEGVQYLVNAYKSLFQ